MPEQVDQYQLEVMRYGPTYVIHALGNDFIIEVGSFQPHDEDTLSGIDVVAVAVLLWTGVDIAQLLDRTRGWLHYRYSTFARISIGTFCRVYLGSPVQAWLR